MGYLHGNSNRSQGYTCKHNHDINQSPCPICEQEKAVATAKKNAAIRAAADIESGGNYLHRIPLSKVIKISEVDDYYEGWVSVQDYIKSCKKDGACPVYDPRDDRVYPDTNHSIGFSWR